MKFILTLFSCLTLTNLAIGAITHTASSTAKATGETNLSLNHNTPIGLDRILVIGITNDLNESVDSITYNGIHLTEGGNIIQNNMRVSLWYLVAPNEGNYIMEISLSGACDIYAGANTYTGVDQTNPWGTFVKRSGKSTSSFVTVPSAPDELVVDVIGLISPNSTEDPTQTLRHRIGGTLLNSSSTEAGASSVLMSWTHTDRDWGIIAAPLKPTAPLPVKLIYFSADIINQGKVKLSWATAYEENNDYFLLEKSRNGINWNFLSTIEGAGNTSLARDYEQFDELPFRGSSYYRLKQVDYDGTFQYSESISIQLEAPNQKITVYPNPVAAGSPINLLLRLPLPLDYAKLDVINFHGQVVYSYQLNNLQEGFSSASITLDDLSEGIYHLRLWHPDLYRPVSSKIIINQNK